MADRQYDTPSERAVAEATRPVLSPSQISTAADCMRLWGWRYIAKIRTPDKPSNVVGTRVHTILECYERDGVAPNRLETLTLPNGKGGMVTYYPGAIAYAMLSHLPPAGSVPAELIESHFLLDIDGILIQGYRDLRGVPLGKVNDHKTTSDISKYAKTPEILRKDPQALIYARAELEEITASGIADGEVTCEWVYGQTKGRQTSRVVSIKFSGREEVEAGIAKHVLPVARAIYAAHVAAADVEDKNAFVKTLPYNIKACHRFGGCDHVARCGLTTREKLVALSSKEEIVARLRARQAAQSAPAAGGAATPSPAPEAPAAPRTTLDEIAARASNPNPPEAPTGAAAIAPAPEPEAQATPPADVPAPAAPKRGRPPKVAPAAGATGEVRASQMGAVVAPAKGFTLYVGCAPVRASTRIYAGDLIAKAAATVCASAQTDHVGLLDFGKGYPALAAQLREDLEASPIPDGAAVIMPEGTPEGRAVFQVLSALAAETVLAGSV